MLECLDFDKCWRIFIFSLGLELCPADTGPHYRLKYRSRPNEHIFIGMKQIRDSAGRARVFRLARDGDGLWLDGSWAEPAFEGGVPGTSLFSANLFKSLYFSSDLTSEEFCFLLKLLFW